MATTQARDLISDALLKLGIYAPGEQIADADAALGLGVLNDMIDHWGDEFIYPTYQSASTVSLVNATPSYTIGTGGVFNVARPLRIPYGPSMSSVTASAVTTPLNVVSKLEWDNLYNAGTPGSGVPNTLFYDPQYPLGILYFAPTPNGAMTAAINALVGLTSANNGPAATSFAALSTGFTLSPGVKKALESGLAVALKSYFTDAQLAPEIIAQAVQSRADLQMTHQTSRAMLRRNRPVLSPAPVPPRA